MYKAGIPTTESAVLWAASAFLGACAGILGRKLGQWMLHEKERAVPELTSGGDLLTAALLSLYFLLTIILRGGFGPSVLRDWGFAFLLLILTVTDLLRRKIPNGVVLSGIVLWVLWLVTGGLLSGMNVPAAGIIGASAAILFSAVLLILALIADRFFQKETLGGGDVKLVFMIMLHLGFLRGFLCMMIALGAGLLFLFARKERTLPWAPSIAVGALAAMLLGAYAASRGLLPASS